MSRTFKCNLLCFLAVVITAVMACLLPFLSRFNPEPINGAVVSSGRCSVAPFNLTKESATLAGEWEFYWNKQIVSDNLTPTEPDAYVTVPASWTTYDKPYTGGGTASYRAYVTGIGSGVPVVVGVPNLPCACRVYVDRHLVYANRFPSGGTLNAESSIQIFTSPVLVSPNGYHEIVVEVDTIYAGGLTDAPVISSYAHFQATQFANIAMRYLIIGAVLLFMLGAILLCVLARDASRQFWLLVLCVVFVIRMLLSADAYLVSHVLFFDLNYELLTSLIYVSTYIIKLAMMMHLVTTGLIRMKQGAIVAISALFLICAFVPYFLFERIYIANVYMWLQSVAYLVDIVVIRKLCGAVVDKHRFGRRYLLMYCITVAAIMLDNFYINGFVIPNVSLVMPFACVVFIGLALVEHTIHTDESFRAAQKASALRQELADLNMTVMLSQIQPHFLYNALNTIKYLIRRDPKAAENAVVRFSAYLRANMDSLTQKEPIDFAKELEHVQNYIAIEQVRFGERLNVEYDIQVTNFTIPPLTIQPLAENAIKHGVNQKPEGGTVRIATREEDGFVCVTVSDDGVGFDPDAMVEQNGRSHVGLSNIRTRLKEMMNADVEIKSTVGVGTTVTIRIPRERNVQE